MTLHLPVPVIRQRRDPAAVLDAMEERQFPTLSLSEYLNMTNFSFNGGNSQLIPSQTMPMGDRETVDPTFAGYIQGIYKRNGPVFACMAVRMRLFSEARFQFSKMDQGRRGRLFGNLDLEPLEKPWPGGTTGDLLAKMIQFADLAGNAFVLRDGDRLRILRPDWVDIALAVDSRNTGYDKVGYAYWPGGRRSGQDPVALGPEEVAHFAPNPDPEASYRGMSWLTPILREITGDSGMTAHKNKFLEQGATANMVVKIPEGVRKEAFEMLVEQFKAKHEGLENAYKTIVLSAGADATVVGANFEQMDFKTVQGAGETRIAAAAEVPPVIAGFSEGLAAATYSNYQLAMRRFVDLTMRPLWRNASGSLSTIITVPSDSELWYDDRDVPALHENARDAAEIDQIRAATIHTLITAGFRPDDVIAIVNPEWTALAHTGLFSVQLAPAGSVGEGKGSLLTGTTVPASPVPAANGKPAGG